MQSIIGTDGRPRGSPAEVEIAGQYLSAGVSTLDTFRCTYRIQERQANHTFKNRAQPDVATSSTSPRHVLCIVVDALRADMVSRELTPFLANLDGSTAVAPAPWTFPSVSSLLTGQYPHTHEAMRQTDNPDNATEAELTLPPKLSETVQTLPDYLAGAGYETYGGFAFQMPFLAASGRFQTHRLYSDADVTQVLDEYLDWVRTRRNRPTFGYLHLSDLHEPVTPPAEYWDTHEVNRDIPNITGWDYTDGIDSETAEQYRTHRHRLYRAGVDYVDDQLASFFEELIQKFDTDPVVVVTSDHGEALWEQADFDAEHFYDSRPAYAVGHGGTPYESVARVPLLGYNVDVSGQNTSLVDVTPTLLEWLGIEPLSAMDGHALSDSVPDNRIRLIEATRYGYERKAAYRDEWKLVVSPGDDEAVGFSLPDETPTVLPDDVRTDLQKAFPQWPDGEAERTVDGAVQQRLESLGYK